MTALLEYPAKNSCKKFSNDFCMQNSNKNKANYSSVPTLYQTMLLVCAYTVCFSACY